MEINYSKKKKNIYIYIYIYKQPCEPQKPNTQDFNRTVQNQLYELKKKISK